MPRASVISAFIRTTVADGLTHDIRHGGRLLRHQPGFTLVAVLTLALGIGATSTLFSVAYGVLSKPLPWPDADRLVRVEERRGGHRGSVPWTVTNGTYRAWSEQPATVESIGSWISSSRTFRGAGEPERLAVAAVTPNLFTILKTPPAIGRLFINEDATFRGRGTAVLSYGFWQERFGGDRSVVGTSIQLDDRHYDVVGVMPRRFTFPNRETRIWVPFYPLPVTSAGGRQISVITVETIARLKPGMTLGQAAEEATARARSAPNIGQAATFVFGSSGDVTVVAAPVLEVLTGSVNSILVLLFSAAALLLAASTASVVSIQLARATTRLQETTVRAAMGASHARLLRQWLVESALLGICAGSVGLVVAWGLLRILPAALPADFPRVEDIGLDGTVALFTLAVTLIVSIVCGTVPSLFVRPTSLAGSFSQDRTASVGTFRSPAVRIRMAIMSGQVAIACVLVIGGGLMGRTLMAMTEADRGYDPANLITARLVFPHAAPAGRRIEIVETLQDRLRSLPGVRQAAFGEGLPLVPSSGVLRREIPSPHDPAATVQIDATRRVVSPDYLSALRLRLVSGRLIGSGDTSSSVGAIVVNRQFAAAYVGDNAVGKRLRFRLFSVSEWEIVGVVDDAQHDHVSAPPRPEVFVSYRQIPDAVTFDPMLVVRTDRDPVNYVSTIRMLAKELDQSIVFDSVMTMDDRVSASMARPRLYAVIFAGFATLALVIAGVGLFGVLSHTTAQRTPEIGLRIALGAAPTDVASLVVRQVLTIVSAGLTIGLIVTVFAAEFLSKMLYGVTTRDPVSFLLAPLLIGIFAAMACAVPTWRAATIDPLQALRDR